MKWSVVERKLAKVDRILDKAIDAAEMPGAVVYARMHREGEVLEHVSERGFAVVRPERIPMRRETIFDVASLTKPVATATSIALLVQDDKLSLDDPVASVLPVFGQADKEAVTFRHLLTHSAGLRPWRPFHEELREREKKSFDRLVQTPAGRDWIVDRVLRSNLVHATGEAAVYGDLDFIALGAAVEAASGERLDAFARERIFAPLGLANTFFVPLPEDGTPIALPEDERRRYAATENCPWRGRIVWGEVHDPNASAMGGVAGHAGLFSTADDLMKFGQTWLDVWHGRSDALPREQVLAFSQRQGIPEGSDWALGWDTPTAGASSSGSHFSANSVGHLGFTGTSLWIDLEQQAVVVMLTSRHHLVEKRSKFTLRADVHDALMEAFLAG